MQENSEPPISSPNTENAFISTRLRDAEPDTFDPNVPRLGRRESERHSEEVTYLHDVLTTNFPDDRTIWDLHHYFKKDGIELDIQFDISYFKDLDIPHTLSSYKAEEHGNKVPTMAINILSKSTWRSDIAEKLDLCRMLKIPLYVVYPTYHVTINIYRPPFLRAYVLQDDGEYKMFELRKTLEMTSEGLSAESIIDVSKLVPFRFGLKLLEKRHQDNQLRYRLVLLNHEKDEILLTESEKKDLIIDEQDKKINEQDKKINEQDKRIEALISENQKLKQEISKKE